MAGRPLRRARLNTAGQVITGVDVDWHIGWANPPNLTLRVAGTPEWLGWRAFPQSSNSTFYMNVEKGGQVKFLYHDPRDERGFGGHVFTLEMGDGTVRKIKGPWSSNASFAQQVAGFDIMDVGLRAGTSHLGGAWAVAQIKAALRQYQPNVEISLVPTRYGPVWEVITPKPPKKNPKRNPSP
jgi:hypothetical protein